MNSFECRPLLCKEKNQDFPGSHWRTLYCFTSGAMVTLVNFIFMGKKEEEEDLNYVQTIGGRIFSGFMINQVLNSHTTHNRPKTCASLITTFYK